MVERITRPTGPTPGPGRRGGEISSSLRRESNDTKKFVQKLRFGRFEEHPHQYSPKAIGKDLSRLADKHMPHFRLY